MLTLVAVATALTSELASLKTDFRLTSARANRGFSSDARTRALLAHSRRREAPPCCLDPPPSACACVARTCTPYDALR